MAKRRTRKKKPSVCDDCTWRNVDVCCHPDVARPARDMYDGRPCVERPPVEKVRESRQKCRLYSPRVPGEKPAWFLEYVKRVQGDASSSAA